MVSWQCYQSNETSWRSKDYKQQYNLEEKPNPKLT